MREGRDEDRVRLASWRRDAVDDPVEDWSWSAPVLERDLASALWAHDDRAIAELVDRAILLWLREHVSSWSADGITSVRARYEPDVVDLFGKLWLLASHGEGCEPVHARIILRNDEDIAATFSFGVVQRPFGTGAKRFEPALDLDWRYRFGRR